MTYLSQRVGWRRTPYGSQSEAFVSVVRLYDTQSQASASWLGDTARPYHVFCLRLFNLLSKRHIFRRRTSWLRLVAVRTTGPVVCVWNGSGAGTGAGAGARVCLEWVRGRDGDWGEVALGTSKGELDRVMRCCSDDTEVPESPLWPRPDITKHQHHSLPPSQVTPLPPTPPPPPPWVYQRSDGQGESDVLKFVGEAWSRIMAVTQKFLESLLLLFFLAGYSEALIYCQLWTIFSSHTIGGKKNLYHYCHLIIDSSRFYVQFHNLFAIEYKISHFHLHFSRLTTWRFDQCVWNISEWREWKPRKMYRAHESKLFRVPRCETRDGLESGMQGWLLTERGDGAIQEHIHPCPLVLVLLPCTTRHSLQKVLE